MKSNILVLLLFLLPLLTRAQQVLTLEDCYALAIKNYPIAKQKELLEQKLVQEVKVLNKEKLPKIDLIAQATYQSEVLALPMAIQGANALHKEQYRAVIDLNQVVYNGGLIHANTQLKKAQTKTQQQQIEVNLYQLKSRIHLYYFGILLLQEKSALLVSKNELLLSKIKEVKSGVKYGAILPTSELILEAEILKIKQQTTTVTFQKVTLLNSLSQLIFTKIDSKTTLTKTQTIPTNTTPTRPEIIFYDLQKQQLEFSKSTLAKSILPKINVFGQGGYGNPGLNMLDPSFQAFYIVGIKANWNIWDWGKNKTDRQLVGINQEIVVSEQENFELNNKIQLQEIENEIIQLKELLHTDLELIKIRDQILASANAQMKNGVITTSEYLTEFVNLYEAKNSLKTHEIQLASAVSNFELIKGK